MPTGKTVGDKSAPQTRSRIKEDEIVRRSCDITTTENIERAKKATKNDIETWFDRLHSYFDGSNILHILEDPKRIFTCDEVAPSFAVILKLYATASLYSEQFGAPKQESNDPIFVQSRHGNLMIIYNGFKFIKERSSGPKISWVCVRKRWKQCPARMTTLDTVIIHSTGLHNHDCLSVLKQNKQSSKKYRLYDESTLETNMSVYYYTDMFVCNIHHKKSSIASVNFGIPWTTLKDNVVRAKKDQQKDSGVLIPSRSGKKQILMLDGFTYNQNNRSTNWYCSSKGKHCKARIRRLHSGEIARINIDHNHEPPSYYQRDGVYIRL
ncbi:Modifier of mdg4 [Operophtera brumata]|uniref:Modifier of mdg4 n=1 Tax=Operophtera brumata TaxID=104452 RepID=A0A0L7LGL9_OPEBR|nr:Modifier of mdg4 [Operophtera brumata]